VITSKVWSEDILINYIFLIYYDVTCFKLDDTILVVYIIFNILRIIIFR